MGVWDKTHEERKKNFILKKYSYRSCPDIGMCRIPPLFWPLTSILFYFLWTKKELNICSSLHMNAPYKKTCMTTNVSTSSVLSHLTHLGNAIMKNQGMTLVLYTYKTHRHTYSKAEYVSRVQQINETWDKIVQPLTQAPRESLLKNKLKFVSVIFMTKPHRAERLRQITMGF